MPEEYEDRQMTCVDCNQPFLFEAGEQAFFAERDLSPPKRCTTCRRKRREQRDTEGGGRGRR